jgi:hypothetical protein
MPMRGLTVWCLTGLVALASGAAWAGDAPATAHDARGKRVPAAKGGAAAARARRSQPEVGPPMRVVHVRLDRLQAYDGYSPARSLMSEVPLVMRLVRVKGEVTSALVQSNTNGTWETVRVGDAAGAQAIDRVATVLKTRDDIDVAELFLVKIPGLGLDFLARRDGKTILLAPLFDAPAYGLTAADLRPAEAVLGSLVAAAQNVPASRRAP